MTPALPMPAYASSKLPAPWFLVPLAATLALCLASPYDISFEAAAIALAFISLPATSYLRWRSSPPSLAIPLFAAVGAMYWLYFCFAFFMGNRRLMGVWGQIRLDEHHLWLALTMAAMGVASMACGYAVTMPLVLRRAPVFRDSDRTGAYLRAILAVGSLLTAAESSNYWLGAGGRQVMTILRSFIPLIAYACLLRQYLTGQASRADRNILAFYAAVSLVSSVASGWLGPLFGLFVVTTSVYVMVNRRLPLPALTAAAVAFFFLQAGKDSFRNNFWYSGDGGSGKFERVLFWTSQSADRWRDALTSQDPGKLQQIVGGSIGRVSLLEQSANVLQLTPSPIPFQNGATYGYMAVSLIPRFLWPGKPSVNDANRFYQVAYGLTAERDLDHVSIAVGTLAESYVNFGWPGVVAVMFLLGTILRLFERVFLSFASGPFLVSTGLALTPSLLVVEAQAAQYLGGVIQYILMAIAIFLPVLKLQRLEESL